jgi:hypothetical protein
MSSNERDTKFLGFANLVLQDLSDDIVRIATDENTNIDNIEHIGRIIAQRAYDLVEHATKHIYKDAIYTQAPSYDKCMLAIVPDMTELP